MRTTFRRTCWLTVLVALATAMAVSIRAADNRPWTTEEALGDVAVSFENSVVLFGNANGLQKGDLAASGLISGMVFDSALNLLATNTSRARIVKYSADAAHTTSFIATQASPASIVLAADGTIYVASAGSPRATVRRIDAGATCGTSCPQFTVPTDSKSCIGIDLSPDQQTLYYVSGGRTVRTVANANTATGPVSATTLSPRLPTPGNACGLRLLPPVDSRSTTPRVATSIVGGMLIADTRNIKRLNASNTVVQTYNAGSEPDLDKKWLDVALDPNTLDFWAVDGKMRRLARFALSGANQLLVNLPLAPFGVALNGEPRAALTTRILNLSSDCTSTPPPACWVESAVSPPFLAGTPSVHEFRLRLEPAGGTSASARLAVQAVEASSDGDAGDVSDFEGICPASFDLDCRIQALFPAATARSYSRGRAVVYMVSELQATPVPDDVPQRTAVIGGGVSPGPGAACGGGPTQVAVALLRDPYPHTATFQTGLSIFEEDITFLVFSDETGAVGRTRNHYVLVDRSDTRYSALMAEPPAGSSQSIGSTMLVAVEIRDPSLECSPVPGLNALLALSITDLTTKQLILDSEGVSQGPATSGPVFDSESMQYQAEVPISSPTFTAGNTIRVCVNAKADVNNPTAPRAIGEVCQDVLITDFDD
jgi:DNA-binding beta-propeller fold protein YncE